MPRLFCAADLACRAGSTVDTNICTGAGSELSQRHSAALSAPTKGLGLGGWPIVAINAIDAQKASALKQRPRSARAALHPDAMEVDASVPATSLRTALLTCLAVTWLNAHVYLDTVLLVGGIAGQYALAGRLWFAAGAMSASCIWLYGLGYGAALLSPLFRKPMTWRVLDALIAVVMWTIAMRLLLGKPA